MSAAAVDSDLSRGSGAEVGWPARGEWRPVLAGAAGVDDGRCRLPWAPLDGPGHVLRAPWQGRSITGRGNIRHEGQRAKAQSQAQAGKVATGAQPVEQVGALSPYLLSPVTAPTALRRASDA